MRLKHYWCYRIATGSNKYFWSELNEGRLRQGWGYDEGQNLRNFTIDEGASRNKSMFNNVKKGDILLVPQLPEWGKVAIVEATEDWITGYKYEIDDNMGDFGHIFPAKFIKSFSRYNENVSGNIRSTLKNPSRFWSINHYANDVEMLLSSEMSELSKEQDHKSRLISSIGSVFNDVFNETDFQNQLFNKLIHQFTREEWEFALVYGLKKLYPFYSVERVGGTSEVHHGTDILVKMPGIIKDFQYAIAIQVKDYEGYVSANEVIQQINKSENYWNNENIRIIEKIVIITKAEKINNNQLYDNDSNVKIIFASDLKQLLSDIGKKIIGQKL